MLFQVLSLCTFFIIFNLQSYALAYEWNPTSLKLDGISSIVKTHEGIYAGEFDTRSWLFPYRGMYFSTDLGETWSQAGLKDRGVVAVSYDKDNKKLYAATHYSVFDPLSGANRGGLFVLKDGVWHHKGPSISTAGVLATKDVVLLGTNAHGLWASFDQGETWTQKIGSGYFGPRFRVLKQSGQRIFVHDEFNVYLSDDQGNTFTNIPALKDEKIADIEGNGQTVIAGTSNYRGAFISYNNGASWTKIQQLEGKIVGKIKYFSLDNSFYAYVKDATTPDIYSSNDTITWQRTYFLPATVNSIEWVFSEPSVLLAAVANDGLYSTKLNDAPVTINQILSPPWHLQTSSELTDKISTFFDHAYPLLGYAAYAEPTQNATTTTNYLGITKPEPFQYYSSHDGIDFALPYGTQVNVAASGIAQYAYQPNGLGHFVKVTHPSGYQTFYGHLQEYPAKNFEVSQQVEQGQEIGKIGISGNTTGPHLHFTVLKDINNDASFDNDIPEGKTDPFGWQNSKLVDPWKAYTWSDALRTHTTDSNDYLWKEPLQTVSKYSGKVPLISLEDLEIDFNTQLNQLVTVVIKRLPSAALSKSNDNKRPIPKLAFGIELFNNFGEKVEIIETLVPLIFSYTEESLVNTVRDTLTIYHFNATNSAWEAAETLNDHVNKKLIANTNSFSLFAVFGEKVDSNSPQTHLTILGTQVLEKYIGSVEVALTANDIDYQSQVSQIFYRINDKDWTQYTQPIIIADSGTYSIRYKSMDEYENMEQEKVLIIEIDQNLVKHKVKVKNTSFVTQQISGY
ncbi:peptidoglycan DD-metalloendopeptidase family protein [Patescibacteria group bacterium]|nr:peptidoglycan DD-metalloendopeptidase family protein [Patescibacteria group bacterium]